MHPVLTSEDWVPCPLDECTTLVRPGNGMCLKHKRERNRQMDEEWGV